MKTSCNALAKSSHPATVPPQFSSSITNCSIEPKIGIEAANAFIAASVAL